jgi:hypothetical protein
MASPLSLTRPSSTFSILGEPRRRSLLEDGDEVAVLDVAGAQHRVESGQQASPHRDVVHQVRAQTLGRQDDVLLYLHQEKHRRELINSAALVRNIRSRGWGGGRDGVGQDAWGGQARRVSYA